MKEGAHFKTFTPQDSDIRKLVAYYYIHDSSEPDFRTSFIYYPHYRNGLTAYINSNVFFDESASHISPSSKPNTQILFSRNYDSAIQVNIKGPFQKLGIAFTPLGINHFIDKPLNVVAPITVNTFDEFGEEFKHLARDILLNTASDPTAQLDLFFRRRLNCFENEKLSSALSIIFNTDTDISVQSLADQLEISRKTLLRHFQSELASSVKSYQKLIRFRNALNNYRETSATSFTALALEHSYYDQPAFIKHFKTITGLSPRLFFKNLQHFGSEDIFWRPI